MFTRLHRSRFELTRMKRNTRPKLSPTQQRKKNRGMCIHTGCRKSHRPTGNECWAHVKQKYTDAHPVRVAYHKIKSKAKQRGIDFDLTFEDFCDFARDTGYVELKGREATAMQVDRINPLEGYTKTNIRCITASANCSKAYEDKLMHQRTYSDASGNEHEMPF